MSWELCWSLFSFSTIFELLLLTEKIITKLLLIHEGVKKSTAVKIPRVVSTTINSKFTAIDGVIINDIAIRKIEWNHTSIINIYSKGHYFWTVEWEEECTTTNIARKNHGSQHGVLYKSGKLSIVASRKAKNGRGRFRLQYCSIKKLLVHIRQS